MLKKFYDETDRSANKISYSSIEMCKKRFVNRIEGEIGEEENWRREWGGGRFKKKKERKKTKIKVKGYYEGGRKRQWMDDRRKVNLSD